ncbi:HEAT repeat domain-containing protein [Escherichia coli]|nr:HEAT repeat domain-containing protein [Escherichia coli]
MSMPPAIANTFLFEMMKSKSKDVTLAAIYALGEGRCQAENITRELHRLSQSDDMEIKKLLRLKHLVEFIGNGISYLL